MTYYRLALQERHTSLWTWKSTGLTSLYAVFQLLRSIASSIPPDRIRVFTSSAKEDLHEMLSRENSSATSIYPGERCWEGRAPSTP
jgi:glucose-6-phosphate isomerase